MPKISDFSFEKWVEKRFGAEMGKINEKLYNFVLSFFFNLVERLKMDPYINSGAMKDLMDYLFNNLYDPEFVK